MDRTEAVNMLMEKDALAFADMTDVLMRGNAELLFAGDDGILIRCPCSTLMGVSFSPDASWADPFISARTLIASHGAFLSGYLEKRGLVSGEPCYLYVYQGSPVHLQYASIQPLTSDYSHTVSEYYGHEESYIRERIESGRLWGIFEDGALAGFGGFHSEGAMGMLEILPMYQRRGYGALMESFMIDTAITEGRVPYCNVFLSNTASCRLQDKLGLVRSQVLTSWMRMEL